MNSVLGVCRSCVVKVNESSAEQYIKLDLYVGVTCEVILRICGKGNISWNDKHFNALLHD